MEAYAVLDGGGIKGAALAGCLKAAGDSGIKFIGYGGTSAGSIVALLGAAGYKGDELKRVLMDELNLGKALPAVRPRLDALRKLKHDMGPIGIRTAWKLRRYKSLYKELSENFGFEDGRELRKTLLKLVRDKLGAGLGEYFDFYDFQRAGGVRLKIVASDLGSRTPAIFSNAGGNEKNIAVLDAVRASMSYPFVFTPFKMGDRYFVDGGLCSNLPVFLFNDERKQDRRPLLAFDLETPPPVRTGSYNLGHLCLDMMDTALEAGDYLMRRASSNIYHIRIRIPQGIGTLDFDIGRDKLEQLFDKGVADTYTFLTRELAPWQQAQNLAERLQVLHAPPRDVKFILSQFAAQLERETGMASVRAQVMLPTGNGKRIVVYQYNMDNDPDQDLDLAEDAGATGNTWAKREPTIADLEDAAREQNYAIQWKMTQEQQAKIRKDRKAMLCVPIFDRVSVGTAERLKDSLIGTLSADTNLSLRAMMWIGEDGLTDKAKHAVLIGIAWSGVLSRILR